VNVGPDQVSSGFGVSYAIGGSARVAGQVNYASDTDASKHGAVYTSNRSSIRINPKKKQMDNSTIGTLTLRMTGKHFVNISNNTQAYTLPDSTAGITSVKSLVGGSAYANNTYANVSLTGGTGSGAAATIVVAGGTVTAVTITTAGSGYAIGDTLSADNADLGGSGSGLSVVVQTTVQMAGGLEFTFTKLGSGSVVINAPAHIALYYLTKKASVTDSRKDEVGATIKIRYGFSATTLTAHVISATGTWA
jgi:hypothetical protein